MLLLVNCRVTNALVTLMFAFVLTVSLVACGKGNNTPQQPSSSSSTITSVVIVGTPNVAFDANNAIVTVTYQVPTLNNEDLNTPGGLVLVCYIGRGTSTDPSLYMSANIPITQIVTNGTQTVITIPRNKAGGKYTVWCSFAGGAISNSVQITVTCPTSYSGSGVMSTNLRQNAGAGALLLYGMIPADCTAPQYFIYSLNLSGPNIYIGTPSDVAQPSCNFQDGGLCNSGDPNVQILATLGGPYDTLDQATAAYCGMVTNIYSAYGGTKGYINGVDYWLDNAPAC